MRRSSSSRWRCVELLSFYEYDGDNVHPGFCSRALNGEQKWVDTVLEAKTLWTSTWRRLTMRSRS